MVTDRDCDQNTCLHLAVENGHYDVVKLCLDKRSDANTPSSNYMHPLHLAAKAGDIRYSCTVLPISGISNTQCSPLVVSPTHPAPLQSYICC